MTQFNNLPSLDVAKRWREQLYPAPIVGAVIRRDETFLLIRRNSEPYQGMWALVGGKWDFGEELRTAVIREVKEETGLDSRFVALRGLVSERFIEGETGAHFLIFLCELEAKKGIASEQAEGAVAWFTHTELDELHAQNTIIPSDYAMLAEFIQANPISFVEAEMSSNAREVQLNRFESVGGDSN